MTGWIWVQLVLATLISVPGLVLGTFGQAHGRNRVSMDDLSTGICQRKYIRNDPSSLESLHGCKVIEGSLQIAVVNSDSPGNWAKYQFPDLREITGYLLLFSIYNLTSMQNLFPNLAVIRGQELVETHALVISTGNQLQEVGLPSLTNITRGSVWIVDNSQLCYVDTINWNLITNESNSDWVAKNKPVEQCPNTCKTNCPKSDIGDGRLCWSSQHCQKVFKHDCPNCLGKPCSGSGVCCSDQCLGGCTGSSPRDCHVCKHVVFKGTCMEECPSGFYEYLQRRCVTRDECLQILALPDISKAKGSTTPLHGKLYDSRGKKMCVLDCPKDTELSQNRTVCVPCTGACKKTCLGTFVDSIEKARDLAGCTRIEGALKISIRRSWNTTTGTIVKELKENLDKIEVIDDYLVITHTNGIVSLDFLENLENITGNKLEDNRYALVIKSNGNLMELWTTESRHNKKINILNKSASVLFHYNPKLCPQKIWEFVAQSGVIKKPDDKIDIGITNGDKVTCNTQILEVEIEKKTNNSVLIRYENFRRNLTLSSHLLNYEIHYKEAPDYPSKNVSKYDDVDPCGDDDWTILEYPKMKDEEVNGGFQKEPLWEHSRLINNLKHYAWYALYVKTVVIPGKSINNNTGAESNIIYFQTLPGVPSKPQNVELAALGPDSNSIIVTWAPPLYPNGELKKYLIWIKPEKENQNVQDQRDYCNEGRTLAKSTAITAKSTPAPLLSGGDETVTLSTKNKDPECCSCSAPTGGKTTPRSNRDYVNDIHYHDAMLNDIISRVFIPQPDYSFQADNRITQRRRRSLLLKRSVEDSSADNSGEKMNDKVFPGEENSPGNIDQPNSNALIGFIKVLEIPVPKSHEQLKYREALKNLTHFTTYEVKIQACRAAERYLDSNSSEIENDTKLCSDVVAGRIKTAPSLTSDNIDPRSISINVTDGTRPQISWGEPKNPNGVVLGYYVRVQRWDGTKYDGHPTERCVTRKNFQAKSNYTFPVALEPGNYSVRIRVVSLARDSDFTVDRYFLIEDTDGGGSLWTFYIIVPVFIAIILGSLFAYYYIRRNPDTKIFSPNPEYMSNVDIPDNWEVPRNKLDINWNKVLGEGSFGKVMEGVLKDFIPGQPKVSCAVKTVSEETTSEYRVLFLREAALMVKLDCHCYHVVKLLGVISTSLPTYVIMEFMANKDLKNYLRSKRRENNSDVPPPTLRQVLRMAAEIADGMLYIHKNKLVHRDLAARNCMVTGDLVVKVGDFGMTKEVIQSDYYRKQTQGLLPVRWMAPESLRDGVYTGQSDVWSFGVVLWEMATLAYLPYQGLSNSQVLDYVLAGRTMERPENCPDILSDLMTMCWQIDAKHRPNFMQLLDRLYPYLDPSFSQVAFYSSPEGQNFREELENKEDQFIGIIDALTPLATAEDFEFEEYDSDEDTHILHHHIVDDLGDTPSQLLLSNPPTSSTITGSSRNMSLTNGLALNPLVIHPTPRNDMSSNSESINLANHALPAPTTATTNPYSRSSNYSRPRTNSNNNNTNPRLPDSYNNQNSVSCSNMNRGGGSAGSSSSISSTTNFASNIPNGRDSLMSIPFHQPTATTGSPKCSLTNNSGDSSKVEQSKANALNSGSSDNSQALMINFSGEGNNSKFSNGNSGTSGGNGYIVRRNSPLKEPVNRTTEC